METTPLGETTRESVLRSTSGRYIALAMTRSVPLLPKEVREYLEPYLDKAFGGEDLENTKLPDILNDQQPDSPPTDPKTSEAADALRETVEDTQKLLDSFDK